MNTWELRAKEKREAVKTIAGRSFTLQLSDMDMRRLKDLCDQHGITAETLLENFIYDLVDGTYSNGSDERDLAERWFQRTWMSSNGD